MLLGVPVSWLISEWRDWVSFISFIGCPSSPLAKKMGVLLHLPIYNSQSAIHNPKSEIPTPIGIHFPIDKHHSRKYHNDIETISKEAP
jgi:hypothetical protein